MPPAARVNDMSSHGPPLNPGPGSTDVMIGYMPAWRALPSSMASAVDGISNAMNSFMSKPQTTPASAAASLAQISQALVQGGASAAAAGAPAAAGAAGSQVGTLAATNATLTATWTTASAAPGGQPAANVAYTEGIKAAAAAAASAVMSAMASLSDMHICPIPCPVPPHGPGFVTKGSSTVLINNLPACRQDDKVMEACGGADPIAMGCPTVIIGDQGGGGGGGGGGSGGAGGGGGEGAGGSAPPATVGSVPPEHVGPVLPDEEPERPTWIGIILRDFNDEPMPNQPFTVTLSSGQVLSGTTDADGYCRFDGVRPGNGDVVFTAIPDEEELVRRQREQDEQADPDRQGGAALPEGQIASTPQGGPSQAPPRPENLPASPPGAYWEDEPEEQ